MSEEQLDDETPSLPDPLLGGENLMSGFVIMQMNKSGQRTLTINQEDYQKWVAGYGLMVALHKDTQTMVAHLTTAEEAEAQYSLHQRHATNQVSH